ncbi:hypothetical protein D9M68_469180 [compost metagenome]
MGQPAADHAFHRRTQPEVLATDQRQGALEGGGGEVFGLLVAGRGDQRDADHGVGFVQHRRGAEVLPVDAQRVVQVARREVRGEGVGQTLLRRQPGAEQAGAEQPDRYVGALPRRGDDALLRAARAEEHFQFGDLLRKVLAFAQQAVAAQRAHGRLVGAGSAAETEIDAVRIEGGEGAEVFRHHQRRMVRQHDAAGTDADAPGLAGDVADQQRGGRTGDAFHVVVLGQPVAGEAETLDVARGLHGVVQRLGGGSGIAHRHQVEHGKGGFGKGLH